jgi:protein-tyrosine phosphatase
LERISYAESAPYDSGLRRAAEALRDGALVVFPTETVYGVGASAAHAGAMRRLRALKGGQAHRPFTVHISARADAQRYAPDAPPLARRLARKLWPGPLTIVLEVGQPEETEAARSIPREQLGEIYSGRTVGLRCPDHAAAIELLRHAGVPVVASSANRAGQPPPLTLDAALGAIGDDVDLAVDAGRTRFDSASTIVEIDGSAWKVTRAGVLNERTIQRAAQREILFVCTGNSCRSPLAEYMLRDKLSRRLGVPAARALETGYVVSSAGTAAFEGGRISSGSADELARRGIDARSHRTQPLSLELLHRAERVYTMSDDHRETILAMAPHAADRVFPLDPSGPVSDPIGGGPEQYQRCAEQIERAVDARLEELLDEDRNW